MHPVSPAMHPVSPAMHDNFLNYVSINLFLFAYKLYSDSLNLINVLFYVKEFINVSLLIDTVNLFVHIVAYYFKTIIL